MSSAIDHLIINSAYTEPREFWRYVSEERSFVRETGSRSVGYIIASSTKKIVDDRGIESLKLIDLDAVTI